MKHYRIIFESYKSDSGNELEVSRSVLMEGNLEKPIDVFTFGLRHEKQIELIQKSQDHFLKEQLELTSGEGNNCPNCKKGRLRKLGKRQSVFHDVFTDHKILMPRHRCMECGYEPGSTVKNILGSSLSGDLMKIQAELGSEHSYRESEHVFSLFSRSNRSINNHSRIKGSVEDVGEQIVRLRAVEQEVLSQESASELVINVDGGHIKSIEDGKRSFEAMTSVVYRPEALVANSTNTHNTLSSKHCAASAKADAQAEMISSTIVSALKQGLSPKTQITALCDGAENCWKIVEAFKPLSASVTCILDWFHISMKIQNISLPEKLKPKLDKVKWLLWHGNVESAITKLDLLIEEAPKAKRQRLEKLKHYLTNNADKIVNYQEREKAGGVFTSNLAESTVESLINQRCKGQQHMRWSREGINPLLQLRAAVASNDWNQLWKTAILNSVAHN